MSTQHEPTIDDLRTSRFLQKHEVVKPVLVTIRGYRLENVAPANQPPQNKWVLEFDELEKPMVMNTVKGDLIAKITGGRAFKDWIGHRIVLFYDETIRYESKGIQGGIGIRAPKIPPQAAPARPAPAQAPRPAPVAAPVVESAAEPDLEGDDVPF